MTISFPATSSRHPSRALAWLEFLLTAALAIQFILPVLIAISALMGTFKFSADHNGTLVDWMFALGWIIGRTYALWVIRGIVRDIRAYRPFTLQNAQRLQFMARVYFMYVVWDITSHLFTTIGNSISLTGSLQLSMDSVPPNLLLALCLFALAEVFRHGFILRQDAELTV